MSYIMLMKPADRHLERDKEKHRRLDNVEFSDLPDPSSPANAFDAAVPLDPGDLLDGSIPLDISHAGGELLAILHDEQDGEQPDYQYVASLLMCFSHFRILAQTWQETPGLANTA